MYTEIITNLPGRELMRLYKELQTFKVAQSAGKILTELFKGVNLDLTELFFIELTLYKEMACRAYNMSLNRAQSKAWEIEHEPVINHGHGENILLSDVSHAALQQLFIESFMRHYPRQSFIHKTNIVNQKIVVKSCFEDTYHVDYEEYVRLIVFAEVINRYKHVIENSKTPTPLSYMENDDLKQCLQALKTLRSKLPVELYHKQFECTMQDITEELLERV